MCSAVGMASVYLIAGNVMALKTVLLELMRVTAQWLMGPSVMILPWQHVVMVLVSCPPGGVMEMLTVLMAVMRRKTVQPCSVVLIGLPVLIRDSVFYHTGFVMEVMTVLMVATRLTAKYPVLLTSSSARMVSSVFRLGGCVITILTARTGLMR